MEREYNRVMRIFERQEGRKWVETYFCDNESTVYRYLADALRIKYLWKSPVYKTVTEDRVGDGTFRKIVINQRDTVTGKRYRETFIVYR